VPSQAQVACLPPHEAFPAIQTIVAMQARRRASTTVGVSRFPPHLGVRLTTDEVPQAGREGAPMSVSATSVDFFELRGTAERALLV